MSNRTIGVLGVLLIAGSFLMSSLSMVVIRAGMDHPVPVWIAQGAGQPGRDGFGPGFHHPGMMVPGDGGMVNPRGQVPVTAPTASPRA